MLDRLMGVLGVIVSALYLTACGAPQVSQVQGRLTNTSGSDPARVVLVQAQADGSLRTVSIAPAQTDLSGRFILQTSLSGVGDLIVVATRNTTEWRAVVGGEVHHGTTVTAPPVDERSTVEAAVVVGAKAEGSSGAVSMADIRAHLTQSVAARIQGDESAAARFAAGVQARAQAEGAILRSRLVAAGETQISSIARIRAEALVSLESSLYAAGNNQAAVTAAWRSFDEMYLSALVDAGLEAEVSAYATEVGSRAMFNAGVDLSSSARLELARRAATFRALALDTATRARFQILGASSAQMSAVAQAHAAITTSVAAAASVGQIAAAFTAFHDTIVAQLRLALGAHASAIAAADASINGIGGAKASLESEAAAAAGTDALVDAYLAFFSRARATALESLSAASDLHAQTAAEILVLVNMQL